jgi:hypothetical protein
MKTEYKHIFFEKWTLLSKKADNPEYNCRNNKTKTILGYISYYEPWSCYVWQGKENCCFDKNCLRDIADFLDQLNKEGL